MPTPTPTQRVLHSFYILFINASLALFSTGLIAKDSQQVGLPSNIRLSVVNTDTIKQMYQFELQTTEDIFKALDIDLELVRLPPTRAINAARSGITHGISIAINGLDDIYPELSPIPTALISDEVWIWVKAGTSCPKNIEDLPHLTTIKILGVILYENTKAIQASPSHQANSFPSALNMLKAGRADYLMFPERGMMHLNQSLQAFTRCLDQPVTMLNLYTYLNKKHATLIPLLNPQYQKSVAHKKSQLIN